MRRKLWPMALVVGPAIALLCLLGTWQLSRLAEKQQLLTEMTGRLANPPVSLAEAFARHDRGEDVEFLKVSLHGRFDHAHEMLKLTSFAGSAGWQVITPVVTEAGMAVLVDRGVVADSFKAQSLRPELQMPIELVTFVRRHDNERGFFDPANDVAARIFYWWDVPAMLAASQFQPPVQAAPFVLQVLPGEKSPGMPQAQPPLTQVKNNHLSYAITWFSLALALLVIAVIFVAKPVTKP